MRCRLVAGARVRIAQLPPRAPGALAASLSQHAHVVHELALMESVVDHVIARVHAPVSRVTLEIGELAGVDVDALRFCFGVCTEHTPLASAALDIVRVPARARCRRCGNEQAMRSLASPCRCGSFERDLVTGDELRLKEVEVCDV